MCDFKFYDLIHLQERSKYSGSYDLEQEQKKIQYHNKQIKIKLPLKLYSVIKQFKDFKFS